MSESEVLFPASTLSEKGQRRGGTYDVNKSKTVPVPIEDLYAAFGARIRKRWFGDEAVRIKKAHKTRRRGTSIVDHLRGRATARMSTDEILALTRGPR